MGKLFWKVMRLLVLITAGFYGISIIVSLVAYGMDWYSPGVPGIEDLPPLRDQIAYYTSAYFGSYWIKRKLIDED